MVKNNEKALSILKSLKDFDGNVDYLREQKRKLINLKNKVSKSNSFDIKNQVEYKIKQLKEVIKELK